MSRRRQAGGNVLGCEQANLRHPIPSAVIHKNRQPQQPGIVNLAQDGVRINAGRVRSSSDAWEQPQGPDKLLSVFPKGLNNPASDSSGEAQGRGLEECNSELLRDNSQDQEDEAAGLLVGNPVSETEDSRNSAASSAYGARPPRVGGASKAGMLNGLLSEVSRAISDTPVVETDYDGRGYVTDFTEPELTGIVTLFCVN